jgi:hypothetical protein
MNGKAFELFVRDQAEQEAKAANEKPGHKQCSSVDSPQETGLPKVRQNQVRLSTCVRLRQQWHANEKKGGKQRGKQAAKIREGSVTSSSDFDAEVQVHFDISSEGTNWSKLILKLGHHSLKLFDGREVTATMPTNHDNSREFGKQHKTVTKKGAGYKGVAQTTCRTTHFK